MSDTQVIVSQQNIDLINGSYSVEHIIKMREKVKEVMQKAMTKEVDYGVIPGTTDLSLLKPGMEKLCMLFRFDAQYTIDQRITADDHYTITSTCVLYHIPTGSRISSGMGLCSSRESKYAYRKASRVCPSCDATAIIKGKVEYGGGWVCFKKSGGCGAKFEDQDPKIVDQSSGRVENEDIADQFNTILKMANKRALSAAIQNALPISDLFHDEEEVKEKAKKEKIQTNGDVANKQADKISQEDAQSFLSMCTDLGLKGKDLNDFLKSTLGGFKNINTITVAEGKILHEALVHKKQQLQQKTQVVTPETKQTQIKFSGLLSLEKFASLKNNPYAKSMIDAANLGLDSLNGYWTENQDAWKGQPAGNDLGRLFDHMHELLSPVFA